jgi:Phage gp6-like head-tail connector protein
MSLEYSRITITTPLVPLTDAKLHLRITGTADDADITAKLAAAQDQVLAKLGTAADATWTPSTAPLTVKHSILLLLDAFYERRGGDEAADQLRKALETIDLLLALYRDPTLA